ncbi:hypothetical protein [Telluria beijingensis]|uniref:hypothetical protein n=1 Tax=Telluria beijingensis TaxID=3068633 RepID=UPI0027957A0D|nr:hypothetical protein [Massilia sp. REN29]
MADILKGDDYPVTSGYTRKIDYIDFESHGQKFTQVVVTLTPDKPRLHKGRKLVVVGGEPGSEYAMDFLETPEGKEGPGIWLARRGVKFVGLTRVGRWNFLDKDGVGSWQDIPLDTRMPIFNRAQKAPWSAADFEVKSGSGKPATSGDSNVYRVPKEGSPLYSQMLAATPITYLTGYRKAIEHAVPPGERKDSYLLYWGMSTGGAFLYPLAQQVKPDGYLGWGTSSSGLAYVYRKATQGDFKTPYTNSALRLRERGLDDFGYYTKELDEQTRLRWWKTAQKGPRFKSAEDATMQFNAGSLTEVAMRLWLSDSLPAAERKLGLSQFMRNMLEPSFPAQALKDVAVLEMNGTLDEAIPPKVVDAHREVMEPHARKFKVVRVQDFHHYLFTQDSIKVVGNLWLRHIDAGYFDAR